MSREKLREAIEYYADGQSLVSPSADKHITALVAAARAYACERCGGTGGVTNGMKKVAVGTPEEETLVAWTDCTDCTEWRRIADGGEE